MVKRIIAIMIIFAVAAIAWAILGSTNSSRTYDQSGKLYGRVEGLWGSQHLQEAPTFYYLTDTKKTVRLEDGKYETVTEQTVNRLTLAGSDINVALDLTHRKKGLMWYATYRVNFAARYLITNPFPRPQQFMVDFAFPSKHALYDNFQLVVNGRPVAVNDFSKERITIPVMLQPNETASVEIGYLSQGLDKWCYTFGETVSRVENFALHMTTNFADIDFPGNTISPDTKERTATGWKLAWQKQNFITGKQIGMDLPNKLNPGPLASQISYFAPVSLLFFFFVIFMLSVIREIRIHPMNYLFLAASFFAFHLLFSYTVDHLAIWLAFLLSSLVSLFLVISYMRAVVGARFAAIEVGLSQFIFLILFSLAHFFAGYTGLTVTIGAILTLWVMMQLTAKIDWEEKFRTLK